MRAPAVPKDRLVVMGVDSAVYAEWGRAPFHRLPLGRWLRPQGLQSQAMLCTSTVVELEQAEWFKLRPDLCEHRYE